MEASNLFPIANYTQINYPFIDFPKTHLIFHFMQKSLITSFYFQNFFNSSKFQKKRTIWKQRFSYSKVQPISIGPPPNLTTWRVICLKRNYNTHQLSGLYPIHYHGDHGIKDRLIYLYANDAHYDMNEHCGWCSKRGN